MSTTPLHTFLAEIEKFLFHKITWFYPCNLSVQALAQNLIFFLSRLPEATRNSELPKGARQVKAKARVSLKILENSRSSRCSGEVVPSSRVRKNAQGEEGESVGEVADRAQKKPTPD